MSWARRPVLYAVLAVALACSWQAATVHFNYRGNWSALFCTGALFNPPPAALESEHIYRFPDSYGYDGQLYHYMAHDPFLRRGFQSSLDSPRLRCRRILVPLAAWILAAGADRRVDRAYLIVVWLWVFAGTFWTACVIRGQGGHPGWSLGFLFIPAVTVSLDRLTVDVALVALTSGIVWYAERRRWRAVVLLCALACLVRESGSLVPGGIAAWCVFERQFRRAAAVALSTLPAIGWYLYVGSRTPPGGLTGWFSPVPFKGLLTRLATPTPYQFLFAVNTLATVLDYAALTGIVAAVVYCAIYWRPLAKQPDGFIAFAFVALIAAVSTQAVWVDAYTFARGFSPLMLIVWLDGFQPSRRLGALPIVLTAPRIGAQIGPRIVNVARGLLGL